MGNIISVETHTTDNAKYFPFDLCESPNITLNVGSTKGI